jgi:hypothetical protein
MRIAGRFTNSMSPSTRKRVKTVNSGFNKTAQRAVDTLATVAAEKTAQALPVDGWPVIVHRYRCGGDVCTCKTKTVDAPNPFSTDLEIDDTLNQEVGGFDAFTQPSLRTVVQLRGDGVASNPKIDRNTLQSNPVNTNTNDMLFDDTVDSFPEMPTDLASSLAAYSTLDHKPCGLCGGTGFTDSYQWVSGQRILLTPAMARRDANSIINTDTRPHSLDITGPNSVYWTVEIPAYFEALELWRARDNIDLATEVALTLDATGTGDGPWTPFSVTCLDALKGKGGKIVVRATAKANNDETVMFTHVELFLRTNALPYCQFPQLDRDINGSTLEALLNVNFEIDPKVGALPRKTLIECVGMARLWYVTQTSNKQTAKGFVFNITGQCQVVQPDMPFYSVAFYPRWAPKNHTAHNGINPVATKGFPHTNILPYDEDEYANGNKQP